jgi:hypothetical protein
VTLWPVLALWSPQDNECLCWSQGKGWPPAYGLVHHHLGQTVPALSLFPLPYTNTTWHRTLKTTCPEGDIPPLSKITTGPPCLTVTNKRHHRTTYKPFCSRASLTTCPPLPPPPRPPSLLTSPGDLTFNPEKDTLVGADGREVHLESPYGDELPAQVREGAGAMSGAARCSRCQLP